MHDCMHTIGFVILEIILSARQSKLDKIYHQDVEIMRYLIYNFIMLDLLKKSVFYGEVIHGGDKRHPGLC